MSAKVTKFTPLLTDFVRKKFDFNGKNLAESLIRDPEDNLKLLERITELNYRNIRNSNLTEGIRPPRLIVCDPKDFGPGMPTSKEILGKALAIVTDTDDTDIKTIEIFDPNLESDLVKLAKEYKRKYSKQHPNLVIKVSITPRPKLISIQ